MHADRTVREVHFNANLQSWVTHWVSVKVILGYVASFCVHHRNLLEAPMKITPYNQHTRLLSFRVLVSMRCQRYSASGRSRRCYLINYAQNDTGAAQGIQHQGIEGCSEEENCDREEGQEMTIKAIAKVQHPVKQRDTENICSICRRKFKEHPDQEFAACWKELMIEHDIWQISHPEPNYSYGPVVLIRATHYLKQTHGRAQEAAAIELLNGLLIGQAVHRDSGQLD